MAKRAKETAYWGAVILYGVVLFCALLYLRFPVEKFRSFCERAVERKVEGVSCSIGAVAYVLPFEVQFRDLALTREGDEQPFYQDEMLSVLPVWNEPFKKFLFTAAPYGGNIGGSLIVDRENQRVGIRDVVAENIDLALLPQRTGFDREISGSLGLQGSAELALDSFSLITAEGTVSVTDGAMELKKPILQQTTLGIRESSAAFVATAQEITLSNGVVISPGMKTDFEGKLALSRPLSSTSITVSGKMTPDGELYKKNRQLKAIVARMQKKYKNSSLPFTVGGSAERPTFVFGN